eukprot:scaffold2215_cov162-Amphora_coffeaeformis.AAC.8
MSDIDAIKPILAFSENATIQTGGGNKKTTTKESIFRKNINTKVTYDEDDSMIAKRGNNIDSIFRKRIDTQVTNEEDDYSTSVHGEEEDKKFVDKVADPTRAKKPCVIHQLAEKVKEKVRREMFRSFYSGTTTMTMEEIAPAVGYKNQRSPALRAALNLLHEDGIVEKQKMGWYLTEKGIRELALEDDDWLDCIMLPRVSDTIIYDPNNRLS